MKRNNIRTTSLMIKCVATQKCRFTIYKYKPLNFCRCFWIRTLNNLEKFTAVLKMCLWA